jgi:hypothetical protein
MSINGKQNNKQGFGRQLLDSLRQSTRFDAIGKLKVEVIGGRFKGAKLELPGRLSCGSGVAATVVLMHPKIAGEHFTVEKTGLSGSSVRVAAVGGAVMVNQKTAVQQGQWLDVGLPITVKVADETLRIEHSLNLMAMAERGAMMGLFALSLTGALWFGWHLTELPKSFPTQTAETAPAPEPAPAAQQMTLTMIKNKLAELGLLAQIEVGLDATRAITLAGEVGTEEVGKWREFLKWYDQDTNMPPLLNGVQRSTKATTLPRIAVIWFGTDSKIFFTDGSQAKVGDKVFGKLVVQKIARDHVTLTRGEDVIEWQLTPNKTKKTNI